MAESTGASVDRRERFDNKTRFFLARWDEVKRLGKAGDADGAERICQELLGFAELGESSENFLLTRKVLRNTDSFRYCDSR